MAGLEKRILEKEGFTVLVADDAGRALEMANAEPRPDLMVIDYKLPDMTGVDLMSRINPDEGENIPSIILTAAGNESVAVSAMKLGAMDYIVKDVETVMKLPAICREVLRKSDLARENARLTERMRELNEELTQSNRKLEELSRRDDLTGLYNRRYLMEVIEHECAHSHRYGTPLCFALFDLDRFKEINDTHGHPAGDEVLRQLAVIFTGRLRKTDRVFRYGGEEFAVVMAGAGLEDAINVCEDLRERVGEALFGRDELELRLTISAGVAHVTDGMSDEELIEMADKSLYAAKEGGRNRVVSLQKQEN